MNDTVKQQRERRRAEARHETIRKRELNSKLLVEFQPDAVEIEKRSVPGGARWTLYAVVALLICSVCWAWWAEVDRIVTAQGKLITTMAPVVIQTVSTAPIRTMNAQFGDRVTAGEVLATLDPTFSEADLASLKSKRLSLQSIIARLRAEKDQTDFIVPDDHPEASWLLQKQVFLERANQFRSKLDEYDSEINKVIVKQENNVLSIEHLKDAYAGHRKYEASIIRLAKKGSKSEEEVLSRRLQTGQAEMRYLAARNQSRELERESDSIRAQRDAYVAQWRSELVTQLAQATEEHVQIEEDLSKAVRSNELVELRVPQDMPFKEFVVFEVADRSVGSVLKPGEALFRLVPVDVPLEAEVEIEGRDISKINQANAEDIESGNLPDGSTVRVKLGSFPYQKHGTIDGAVRAISEGSFEKQGAAGRPTGATMYKARIQLMNPEGLNEVPDNFRLMPGMTTTAEIKVGRRRVIDYFLYPLLRYADESIREP
jgi:HlyD family secretion protein